MCGMMRIFCSLFAVMFMSFASHAVAQSPHVANHAKDNARIEYMTKDLRCLTCPNESVAESNSPMALDVKHYIAERVQQGAPDRAIIEELTIRYGEELRYKPVMAPHTYLLWFAPVLALIVGLGLALRSTFSNRFKKART
jgi:cytochrome c-type biogenesis protein CcmH